MIDDEKSQIVKSKLNHSSIRILLDKQNIVNDNFIIFFSSTNDKLFINE